MFETQEKTRSCLKFGKCVVPKVTMLSSVREKQRLVYN